MRPARTLHAWVFRIVAALVSTTIALVAAEVAVRWLAVPEINPVWRGLYQLSDNEALRYELTPNAVDRDSTTSSDGLRDREYDAVKPSGTFRIAVVGDSIAYGVRVKQSETFSSQLERLLNRYYREPEERFEVLNFGVTGYSFQQSLEVLRLRVFAWDPDLILFAYCLNDPQEYSLEFEHLLAEMTDTERSHRAPRSAAEHSRLFALVRYLMSVREGERKRKVEDGDDPQFRAAREGTLADYVRSLHASERTWAPVASGLEELESITEARDVPTHFVVFPLLDDFDNYQLADTHAFLATSFSQRSFATLDLLVPFSLFATHVDRRVGFDSLHPTRDGHAFVAVAILRHLLQTQALPTLGGSDVSKLLEGFEPESGYAKLLEP